LSIPGAVARLLAAFGTAGAAAVAPAEPEMAGWWDGSWSGDVATCAAAVNAAQTTSIEINLRMTR
jgi:hypothetical protein